MATKVKLAAPVKEALCPSGLVTVTFAAPVAWGGVTAVIVVALITLTLVAALPANVTVAPATKLPPLIFTEVPPAVLPDCGLIEVNVGAGLAGAGGSLEAAAAVPEPRVTPQPASPKTMMTANDSHIL